MPTQKPTIPQTQSTADEQVAGTADSFVLTQTGQVHCRTRLSYAHSPRRTRPAPFASHADVPHNIEEQVCGQSYDEKMLRFILSGCTLKSYSSTVIQSGGKIGRESLQTRDVVYGKCTQASKNLLGLWARPFFQWPLGGGVAFDEYEWKIIVFILWHAEHSHLENCEGWKVPVANRAISELIVARLTTTAVILSINVGEPAYTSGRWNGPTTTSKNAFQTCLTITGCRCSLCNVMQATWDRVKMGTCQRCNHLHWLMIAW